MCNKYVLNMEKKNDTEKIDVITINGMITRFGVSRSTLYKKYIPKLTEIPTTDTKVYFRFDEALKVHQSFKKGIENLNVIA